jgi:hypothetical protein
MRVTNALAIEHIQPKKHFPWLADVWDNFLLICSYCNSSKLDEVSFPRDYVWPDQDDTHIVFEYLPLSATVISKTDLTDEDKRRSQNTLRLYGLQKEKTATGAMDTRFAERLRASNIAIKRLLEYTANKATVDAIVDSAESTGFFSVWLKVFERFPEVRRALIECPSFYLTGKGFFDQNLQPISRKTKAF